MATLPATIPAMTRAVFVILVLALAACKSTTAPPPEAGNKNPALQQTPAPAAEATYCAKYSDGCNTCNVSFDDSGTLSVACTEMGCVDHEPSFECLSTESLPASAPSGWYKQCQQYFDGCNDCSGDVCTERHCEPAELEEPRCIQP